MFYESINWSPRLLLSSSGVLPGSGGKCGQRSLQVRHVLSRIIWALHAAGGQRRHQANLDPPHPGSPGRSEQLPVRWGKHKQNINLSCTKGTADWSLQFNLQPSLSPKLSSPEKETQQERNLNALSVCDYSSPVSYWVPEGERRRRWQLITDQKPFELWEPAQHVLAQPALVRCRPLWQGDREREEPDESVYLQRGCIVFWLQGESSMKSLHRHDKWELNSTYTEY